MQLHSVKECLQGGVAEGAQVEVRGWVRTRRDSKAGLSFVQLSDGSCQGTLQIVAPKELSKEQERLLVGDYKGHPSITKWVDKGYRIIVL